MSRQFSEVLEVFKQLKHVADLLMPVTFIWADVDYPSNGPKYHILQRAELVASNLFLTPHSLAILECIFFSLKLICAHQTFFPISIER